MGEPIDPANEDPIVFDFNPSLEVSFTGGAITSDGGSLLLRQLDEALGLVSSLGAGLYDPRDPAYVKHPLVELLRERLYMLALGYEDTNDARTMRDDPALKLAVRGRGTEAFRAPLGSQPTVSRLEHEILLPRDEDGEPTREAWRNLELLEDAPLRWTEIVMARHKAPERLALDLDSSEDRVHGKQEGSAYSGYFEHDAFHPLFAHLGDGLGELIKARLRPGNVYTSAGVVDFVKPLVPRLLAMTRVVHVRADSGFAVPELFEHLEALDAKARVDGKVVLYTIKLKHNAVLDRLALPHLTRSVGRPPNHAVMRYVELAYKAESWTQVRRVVLAVKFMPDAMFPETAFLVTNATAAEVAAEASSEFYRRRGDDSENRIKEAKTDIKIDRTSCHSFESNRVRLALATCAYLIAHWVRTLGRRAGEGKMPPPAAPSLKTVQGLLFKIGARLLLHARRAYLLMASACTAQSLFRAIFARLRLLASAAPASLVRVPLSVVLTE
jgi:hypothetical protein